MPTLTVDGYGDITARNGERLVLALERGGVDILHRCGGFAKCTTCRVEFSQGEPERMTEAERVILSDKGLLGAARLSCQLTCEGDMSLRPVMTVQNSGMESGKTPAEQIQPEPVWIDAPSAN